MNILKEKRQSLRRLFHRLVIWLATTIDDILIWFYVWTGGGDTPCGRVQSWARETRQGDGFQTTMNAKKKIAR